MPEQEDIGTVLDAPSVRASRPARRPQRSSTRRFEHIREGKHGARSTKQAIAIGLSKARRAGVKLPPPKKGQASRADA